MQIRETGGRGRRAQMSIDFLIGMTLFAAVFFFVFSFASSSIVPFSTTSEEVPTKTQKVADTLYYEELDGDGAELNLTYLKDNEDDVQQMMDDLGVDDDRYGLNVTVEKSDGVGGLEVTDGGDDVTPPDAGSSVSQTVRVGTVEDPAGITALDEGDTVIVRVRVW
ncbi:MAG: hypothetical protein ACLFMT_02565 [Halobacteriales archaeon]